MDLLLHVSATLNEKCVASYFNRVRFYSGPASVHNPSISDLKSRFQETMGERFNCNNVVFEYKGKAPYDNLLILSVEDFVYLTKLSSNEKIKDIRGDEVTCLKLYVKVSAKKGVQQQDLNNTDGPSVESFGAYQMTALMQWAKEMKELTSKLDEIICNTCPPMPDNNKDNGAPSPKWKKGESKDIKNNNQLSEVKALNTKQK